MRPTPTLARFALSLAFALAPAGCGHRPPFDIQTPPGFVELEADKLDYDYRATSANGVVTAVRVVETRGRGDLGFWANVVNTRVREELNYAPVGEAEVAGVGLKGRLLRFAYEQGGKAYAYEIVLYAAGDRLYVLEAGGRKDLFERSAEQLAWQRRTFQAD